MADDLGTSVDPPSQAMAKGPSLTMQMMQNPAIMAALTKDIGSIRGRQSTYISSMPEVIQRRIRALKNIQVECQHVEARFLAEVQALERRFETDYQHLFSRRHHIVNGQYEPTDAEATFAPDEDVEAEEDDDEETDKKVGDDAAKAGDASASASGGEPISQYDENTKGIPEFWLTAMKNVDEIASSIQDGDEEVLRHLEDVTLKLVEQPLGFVLEFHFSDNEFFTDKVLRKTYLVKIEVDEKDPWTFDGPQITSSGGCDINWKKGKNLTVKTVKKKQRNKNKGQTRVVTKQVKTDSFFNFFSPPAVPDEDEDLEDDSPVEELGRDFEIGMAFRDNLIPRAVLFFTGDAVDEEDFDDYSDDEGDEMDDDEDEEDPDYKPKPGEKPQECSQQ